MLDQRNFRASVGRKQEDIPLFILVFPWDVVGDIFSVRREYKSPGFENCRMNFELSFQNFHRTFDNGNQAQLGYLFGGRVLHPEETCQNGFSVRRPVKRMDIVLFCSRLIENARIQSLDIDDAQLINFILVIPLIDDSPAVRRPFRKQREFRGLRPRALVRQPPVRSCGELSDR